MAPVKSKTDIKLIHKIFVLRDWGCASDSLLFTKSLVVGKVGFDFCFRLFQTTDVTLACEDDHQIEAHKVVLADVANNLFKC